MPLPARCTLYVVLARGSGVRRACGCSSVGVVRVRSPARERAPACVLRLYVRTRACARTSRRVRVLAGVCVWTRACVLPPCLTARPHVSWYGPPGCTSSHISFSLTLGAWMLPCLRECVRVWGLTITVQKEAVALRMGLAVFSRLHPSPPQRRMTQGSLQWSGGGGEGYGDPSGPKRSRVWGGTGKGSGGAASRSGMETRSRRAEGCV